MTKSPDAAGQSGPSPPVCAPGAAAPPRAANALVLGSVLFSLCVAALTATFLAQSRQSIWQSAIRNSENVTLAAASDIKQRALLYNFNLRTVNELADERSGPQTSAALGRLLRLSLTASTEVGNLFVLDGNGTVVASSLPVPPGILNYSDRDYFIAQRDGTADGLYVSAPFRSRLRKGDPSIALSVRRNGPDGTFAGISAISLSLTYFENIIRSIDPGPEGSVGILRDDGQLLLGTAAQAPVDAMGLDVSDGPVARHFVSGPERDSLVATSSLDHQERLYTYVRVPEAGLVIVVGLSTRALLAEWWLQAWAMGGIALTLCLGSVLGAGVVRREMIRRAEVEAQLAHLSATDPLTGLSNRRHFDQRLKAEWSRAARTGTPLALLAIDTDAFKLFNDHFGHAGGDEVLRHIARHIRAMCRRTGDEGFRIGGDEFVLLLPGTDAAGARAIAQTLCESVRVAGKLQAPVSVSIGVASRIPAEDGEPEALARAADAALYRAKLAGRSRVEAEGVA